MFAGSPQPRWHTAGIPGSAPSCPIRDSCNGHLFLGNSLLGFPRLCQICVVVWDSPCCILPPPRFLSQMWDLHWSQNAFPAQSCSSPLVSVTGIIPPLPRPPALLTLSQHLLPREFNSHRVSEMSSSHPFRASAWTHWDAEKQQVYCASVQTSQSTTSGKHCAQYNGACKLTSDKITVLPEGSCLDGKMRHKQNEQMAFSST